MDTRVYPCLVSSVLGIGFIFMTTRTKQLLQVVILSFGFIRLFMGTYWTFSHLSNNKASVINDLNKHAVTVRKSGYALVFWPQACLLLHHYKTHETSTVFLCLQPFCGEFNVSKNFTEPKEEGQLCGSMTHTLRVPPNTYTHCWNVCWACTTCIQPTSCLRYDYYHTNGMCLGDTMQGTLFC